MSELYNVSPRSIYVHVNAVKSPFSIMTTQFWHPLLFFYWLANDVILAVVVPESPIEFVMPAI